MNNACFIIFKLYLSCFCFLSSSCAAPGLRSGMYRHRPVPAASTPRTAGNKRGDDKDSPDNQPEKKRGGGAAAVANLPGTANSSHPQLVGAAAIE